MNIEQFQQLHGKDLEKFRRTKFGRNLLLLILESLAPPEEVTMEEIVDNGSILAYQHYNHRKFANLFGKLTTPKPQPEPEPEPENETSMYDLLPTYSGSNDRSIFQFDEENFN